MDIKLFSIGLFSSLAFTYGAYAGGPSMVNKCNFSNVNHPNNARGVNFDEECQNAYVLPPAVGKTSITAVQQNLNLGFCPALKNDLKALEESTKIRLTLLTQINKMIDEYKPIQQDRNKLHTIMTAKKAEFDSASDKYSQIKTKEKKIVDMIDEAREIYARKSRLDPNSQETMNAKINLDKILADYSNFLNTEYNNAEDHYNFSKREYNRALNDYEYLNTKYTEGLKPLLELQTMVDNIAKNAIDSYQKYVVLEGLSAQMLFDVDHIKIVQEYQKLNPNLNLNWQPMLIKDAYFSGSLNGNDGNADATAGVIINASIPGLKFQTIKNIDASQPAPNLNEKEVPGKLPFGSVSGNVRLNLHGACPYYTNVNVPAPGSDIKNIASNMVLNTNYTYQLKARRSFTASYNYYNMFSRIERSSSHGGWFSTTTVHSVVEDKESSDWFNIKFDGDSEFQYTPQEQAEITQQEKALLIDRALRQFAMINSGGTPPGLISPPTSGVMYAAVQLSRCNYYYCQVGSFILGTIGSIFGNSHAVSEFKSKTNVWSTDHVSGYQILDRSASMTFADKL